MPESPQAALQRIPGWAGASWTELDGGLTNRAWLVEVSGRKAVLKIDPAPRTAPYDDRREEARIQRLAAEHGLANQVLYASETIYLCEYVDGEVWSARTFDNDLKLVELAKALRHLHQLPLSGRRFDAPGAAQLYYGAAKKTDSEKADRCLTLIGESERSGELCFCHNDLVAENILSAETLCFLDWEYAADNDPLFDLAVVVSHHRLSSQQSSTLLNAYFDEDARRWRPRFAGQLARYEALHWLWQHSRL